VLTPNSPLAIEARAGEVVLNLLARTHDFGAVQHFLNDLEQRNSRSRPFILLGDPAGPAVLREVPQENGTLSIPPRLSIYPLELTAWETRNVIGLEPHDGDLELIRGQRYGAIARNDAGEALRVQIADRSGEWGTLQEWFLILAGRLRRLSRLSNSIRDLCEADLSEAPERLNNLDELDALSRRLEETVHRALRHLEAVRRQGTWDPRVHTLSELSLSAVWMCDQMLAGALDEYLLQVHLHEVLTDGYSLEASAFRTDCGRCGCLEAETRTRFPLANVPAQCSTECPNCGVNEVWEDGGFRLEVTGSASLKPGRAAEVQVRRTGRESLLGLQTGILVAQLKDNGRGRVVSRDIRRWDGKPCSIPLSVPPDTPAEIQTLRVAYVSGLSVVYRRVRLPCIY
jgi:hypothetical protein